MLESILGAAASGLKDMKNLGIGLLQNKFEKRYQNQVYDRQRRDALADYQMQNDYNHPSAQMARLREAGINPVMAFKTSAMEASPIRSSNIAPANTRQLELKENAIANYQNMEVQKLQADNLRETNTLVKNQAAHEAIKAALTATNVDMGKFDLKFKTEMKNYNQEVIKAQLDKLYAERDSLEAGTFINLNRDKREATMQEKQIDQILQNLALSKLQQAKTEEEIRQIKQNIENAKKQGILMDIETNLREEGLSPSDPAYMRIIMQQAKRFGLW